MLVIDIETSTLRVCKTGTAWTVRDGFVDLFIAPCLPDGTTGQRQHLVRAAAGDPIFPVDIPKGSGFALLFVKSPAVRLEEAPVSGGMLARWVELLEAASAPGPVPAGVFNASEVRFCRPRQGSVRLFGRLELPRQEDSYYGVGPTGWLELDQDGHVESITPAEFLDRGLNLTAYHQIILGCLALRMLEQREVEDDQRRRREDREQVVFDHAIERLASHDHDWQAPTESVVAAHPLVRAVHEVARAANVRLQIGANHELTHASIFVQQEHVSSAARRSGVRTRPVQFSGKWWTSDCGPLVAWKEAERRPVALLPAPSGYRLVDPVDNTSQRVTAEVAAALAPSALVFYRPLAHDARSLTALFRFGLATRRKELLALFSIGIATGLLSLLPALATSVLFDSVIPSAQRDQLQLLAAVLVVSAVATTLFTLYREFATIRLESLVANEVQSAIWDRLLRLPPRFFREYSTGDLGSRTMAFDDSRRTAAMPLLSSIMLLLTTIFPVALLFAFNLRLALIASLLLFAAILFIALLAWVRMKPLRAAAEMQGKLAGRVLQLLSGIAKFRVAGAERRAFASWAAEFQAYRALAFAARRFDAHFVVWSSALPVLSSLILYACADTTISTGVFLGFIAAFSQALYGTLECGAALLTVLNFKPTLDRLRPILEAEPEVRAGQNDPGALSGRIEVDRLTFRYRPDLPAVLRDVSFTVAPGEFVAIVGESGCGKSTLLRLLLAFERPESGAVYYDGQDLSGLDPQQVRRAMGVVLQNGRLLAGDILTNLTGGTTRTADDAWEALRLAGLEEDVRAMPMGLETILAEGGGGLSGGQRQRLLIARAVVSRPKILLFDEATSALDNRTQALVTRSLESLRATRIVVAHRLSTIRHADRILVMEKGEIVESGSYEELLAAGGLFTRLAARQVL
ncbi:MAG: NHLP bacteriocin export ABC transporter permease/ATPase subunit [Bryobacterales bacterium]|nr:NHLP bacteriocin export ABC transporter permease/ATPase subunit [Bryobacterales bacterium]